MPKVITSLHELDFRTADLDTMPVPEKVLLVKPTYFDIEYVINPYMTGHVGDVDKVQAEKEWKELKKAYEKLGIYTHVLEGEKGFPDMVFCANQSLPNITNDGKKEVIMSVMRAPERKGEVKFIKEEYERSSYDILYLDETKFAAFEGMGDALWHFKKRLIWGGYGYRTSKDVYSYIAEAFKTPIIALELVDPKFYHLDTCMCILDEHTTLIYPNAFTEDGLALIYALFPNVIEADEGEAKNLFACNATSVGSKNVFIQKGCTSVTAKLKKSGFIVHEFSTGEYIKSGGSVFCMKMLLW